MLLVSLVPLLQLLLAQQTMHQPQPLQVPLQVQVPLLKQTFPKLEAKVAEAKLQLLIQPVAVMPLAQAKIQPVVVIPVVAMPLPLAQA